MFIVILKAIGAAVLGGLLLFALPFLIFKALFFFLFIGLIFRLFAGRRRYRLWRHYHSYNGYPSHLSGNQDREYLTDPFRYGPQKI
ncbi:hypothetical protein GCM10010967_09760 [Dyadobacter beijingensis]|uniref:Uncharacterized protein n=1 Tax=Dyadobacter beijingensis TaxID=365489 RepID=A0ABQ2HHA0_9BACT|nr:hypothetical protein [Dyadobacter beijingensis]GGM80032.1 hypothetical protein GCM10010967_09760 [Dyadobacter beijingensis]